MRGFGSYVHVRFIADASSQLRRELRDGEGLGVVAPQSGLRDDGLSDGSARSRLGVGGAGVLQISGPVLLPTTPTASIFRSRPCAPPDQGVSRLGAREIRDEVLLSVPVGFDSRIRLKNSTVSSSVGAGRRRAGKAVNSEWPRSVKVLMAPVAGGMHAVDRSA